MTTASDPSAAEIEEQPADPLAFRRIWPKARGAQAASGLVLKTFGVLYDAGRALTRPELLDGLLPRLDPYEQAYLQAWDARHRGQIQAAVARNRTQTDGQEAPVIVAPEIRTITAAADRWLAYNFDHRRYGKTLIRDEKDRYRPGPRAPRMQTVDGMVPFTPETRTAQEIADRNASQQHAMELEWKRIQPLLESLAGDGRLLIVAFLARRYAGVVKTNHHRQQVNETSLRSICNHLLRADRPAVQRAILEHAVKWACEG